MSLFGLPAVRILHSFLFRILDYKKLEKSLQIPYQIQVNVLNAFDISFHIFGFEIKWLRIKH
jgi:hypothetical protein